MAAIDSTSRLRRPLLLAALVLVAICAVLGVTGAALVVLHRPGDVTAPADTGVEHVVRLTHRWVSRAEPIALVLLLAAAVVELTRRPRRRSKAAWAVIVGIPAVELTFSLLGNENRSPLRSVTLLRYYALHVGYGAAIGVFAVVTVAFQLRDWLRFPKAPPAGATSAGSARVRAKAAATRAAPPPPRRRR